MKALAKLCFPEVQVKGKRSLTQAEATWYCSREETKTLEALTTCGFMAPFPPPPLNFQQLKSPARKTSQSINTY